MPDLDQLIRDAARSPTSLPDIDVQWQQGRRRKHQENAARVTSLGALAIAVLVGIATLTTDGLGTGALAAYGLPGAGGRHPSQAQGHRRGRHRSMRVELANPGGQPTAPPVAEPTGAADAATPGGADPLPATAEATSGDADAGPAVPWDDLTAPEAFRRLADAAAARAATDQELTAGSYRYVRTQSTVLGFTGDLPPVLHTTTRETWVAPDGSGVIRELPVEPAGFLTDEDRHVWETAMGRSPTTEPQRWESGAGELQSPALPESAEALAAHLRDRYLPDGEPAPDSTEPTIGERIFTALADFFRAPDLSSARLAAGLEVASGVDGYTYLGMASDPGGRDTIGFAYATHGGQWREELYFDPRTGEPLGERSTWLGTFPSSSAQPPIVANEDVVLERGVVTELPAG